MEVSAKTLPATTVAQVSTLHFGTNFLFHSDRVTTGATFGSVAELAHSQFIRYPGGTITEEFFDLTAPNRSVATSLFNPATQVSVTSLSDFLAFASRQNTPVVLVVPTYRFFDPTTGCCRPEAEVQIKNFVTDLLQGVYGQVDLMAFEIGNEWYQDRFSWTASQFGELQSKIAVWISDVAGNLGLVDYPQILIQAGRGDDDNNGIDDNKEFQAQIDPTEADAIDGVVSHAYAATSSTNPLLLGGAIETRLRTVTNSWETFLGTDISHIVTEWNIGEDGEENTTINGLMRSSALLRLFTGMLEAGVNTSAIWTAQARSPAALSGREGGETFLTPTGCSIGSWHPNFPERVLLIQVKNPHCGIRTVLPLVINLSS